MTQPPPLFDEALRRRRLARAAARGSEALLSLHRFVADRLAERLAEINRAFPRVALTAPLAAPYKAALAGRFGVETIEVSPEAAGDAAGDAVGDDDAAGEDAGDAARYDLHLSALDLHGLNDPIAALTKARLRLKPDGLLMAALFGGDSLKELRLSLAEAEAAVEGGLSPRVAPMGEIRELGALLQRAGLAMPVADSETLTLWHESPLHLMREIRAIGETNALSDRRRNALRRATLGQALARYADLGARKDGKTPATVELVTLTGWAPAASQPKALRPGSAASRLADALGAEERPAGEKAGR
ncbi:MAG: SAM-dependent methyltransferase [Pseudomonadota bacterium]